MLLRCLSLPLDREESYVEQDEDEAAVTNGLD